MSYLVAAISLLRTTPYNMHELFVDRPHWMMADNSLSSLSKSDHLLCEMQPHHEKNTWQWGLWIPQDRTQNYLYRACSSKMLRMYPCPLKGYDGSNIQYACSNELFLSLAQKITEAYNTCRQPSPLHQWVLCQHKPKLWLSFSLTCLTDQWI